jgi:chromosome segregation ATPase
VQAREQTVQRILSRAESQHSKADVQQAQALAEQRAANALHKLQQTRTAADAQVAELQKQLAPLHSELAHCQQQLAEQNARREPGPPCTGSTNSDEAQRSTRPGSATLCDSATCQAAASLDTLQQQHREQSSALARQQSDLAACKADMSAARAAADEAERCRSFDSSRARAADQRSQDLCLELQQAQGDLASAQAAPSSAAADAERREHALLGAFADALGCGPGAKAQALLAALRRRVEQADKGAALRAGLAEAVGAAADANNSLLLAHVQRLPQRESEHDSRGGRDAAALQQDIEVLRSQRDAYERQAQEAEWALGEAELKLDYAIAELALLRQGTADRDRRCTLAPGHFDRAWLASTLSLLRHLADAQ